MKTLLLFLITLTSWTTLYGQDGSDILYSRVNQLDESYIGDFVHLDFYRRSFHGINIDTVTIVIDQNPIKFIEHREDTGFNNWFQGQYLESLKKIEGFDIRVVKCRLDKISKDSVFVTAFLEYYKGDKLVPEMSKEVQNEFSRKIIAEVLVSEKSHEGG
jgi:hypothetical protein